MVSFLSEVDAFEVPFNEIFGMKYFKTVSLFVLCCQKKKRFYITFGVVLIQLCFNEFVVTRL